MLDAESVMMRRFGCICVASQPAGHFDGHDGTRRYLAGVERVPLLAVVHRVAHVSPHQRVVVGAAELRFDSRLVNLHKK